MLATYGFETTRIWVFSMGWLLYKLINLSQTQPLALKFSQGDSMLLVGLNTRKLATFELGNLGQAWEQRHSTIFQEDIEIEGIVLNSPTAVRFSPDVALVAIAHRRYPMSVWILEPPRLVNRCGRSHSGTSLGANWVGVLRVLWHPRNHQVLCITPMTAYSSGTQLRRPTKRRKPSPSHRECRSTLMITSSSPAMLKEPLSSTIQLSSG